MCALNDIDAVVVREDSGAGCCGMFMMYLVWFLFGIFGGHYYYKSKLFAQTRSHRLFLFFYLVTFGGFGFLWIYDGFRVGNWVGGYTVGFICFYILSSSIFFLFLFSSFPQLWYLSTDNIQWNVSMENSSQKCQTCSCNQRCNVSCNVC